MHPPWVSHGGPETEFYRLCCPPQTPTPAYSSGDKGKESREGVRHLRWPSYSGLAAFFLLLLFWDCRTTGIPAHLCHHRPIPHAHSFTEVFVRHRYTSFPSLTLLPPSLRLPPSHLPHCREWHLALAFDSL